MKLNVRPILSQPYFGYESLANTVLFGDRSLTFGTCSDGDNIVSAKFSKRIHFASGLSAMSSPILRIVYNCFPRQIIKTVVDWVAIFMRTLIAGRTLANKRQQDQPMNKQRPSNAVIKGKSDCPVLPFGTDIAILKYETNSFARNNAHPPFIANLISGCKRDDFPNFIGIRDFIHSETAFRVGQGRAVLLALLRPASYARFTFRSQGFMAS